VVNRNWATGQMSTLSRFLAAFNKGVDWFRDDRNRDEAINVLVTSGNLKPDEVARVTTFFAKAKSSNKPEAFRRQKYVLSPVS